MNMCYFKVWATATFERILGIFNTFLTCGDIAWSIFIFGWAEDYIFNKTIGWWLDRVRGQCAKVARTIPSLQISSQLMFDLKWQLIMKQRVFSLQVGLVVYKTSRTLC